MAATAWAFYNQAKRYLLDGTVDINTDVFRMSLYMTASNAATMTLSTRTQLTNEVTEGTGYSSSGKLMSTIWSTGASASEMRWNADAVVWTATGTISGVRYAVIWEVGNDKLICQSALSTSQFQITVGNTLTVTPSANGIFELN